MGVETRETIREKVAQSRRLLLEMGKGPSR
jgi:hypothetical protein